MTADEIFKELGYEIQETNSNIFIGIDGVCFDVVFVFRKKDMALTIYKQNLSIREIKLINQKCKELGWFKKSRKEYLKKYYSNNKEKLKERNKQYYQDNKENINEKNREYYRKNREKILERNKQYYRKNNPVQDKFSFYNV